LIVFAVPYVFLGLAVIHTLVRRWSHPSWLLAALYAALVLLGWPILAVLLLGFVEDWAHLRRRLA
jgi:predicted branched-subunit amino acid permease